MEAHAGAKPRSRISVDAGAAAAEAAVGLTRLQRIAHAQHLGPGPVGDLVVVEPARGFRRRCNSGYAPS
jgi:hypothetical protein